MKKIFVAGLIGMAALCAPAMGDGLDGNDLHGWCQKDDDYSQGMCFGYTIGASDGLRLGMVAASQNASTEEAEEIQIRRVGFCSPTDSTLGDTEEVVKLYLVNHPELRDMASVAIVYVALRNAYPCK